MGRSRGYNHNKRDYGIRSVAATQAMVADRYNGLRSCVLFLCLSKDCKTVLRSNSRTPRKNNSVANISAARVVADCFYDWIGYSDKIYPHYPIAIYGIILLWPRPNATPCRHKVHKNGRKINKKNLLQMIVRGFSVVPPENEFHF